MFKACASKKPVMVKENPEPLNVKAVLVEEKPEPSQCLCHKYKGLPGWCGVAGGGVPACDH